MESKKKLFFWDLIRLVLLFFVFYPLFGGAQINPKNLVGWAIETGVSELLTNDGHIWGDFVWIFTGVDLRGKIWLFAQPAIVVLGFLWAYKGLTFAKKLRIFNWFIALTAYAVWTIFFSTAQRYDYFIYAYVLSQTGWPVILTFSVLLSIVLMWLGIVLISGFFIYKALLEEKSSWAGSIPVFVSLGVPGAGHFFVKEYIRGVIFLIFAIIIWASCFYLYYIIPKLSFIPVAVFWAYGMFDVWRLRK